MRLPTHSEHNENAKRVFEKAATQLRVLSQRDETSTSHVTMKNKNIKLTMGACTLHESCTASVSTGGIASSSQREWSIYLLLDCCSIYSRWREQWELTAGSCRRALRSAVEARSARPSATRARTRHADARAPTSALVASAASAHRMSNETGHSVEMSYQEWFSSKLRSSCNCKRV